MLVDGHSRPVSVLDNERHQIYNVWIEKRCMPVLLVRLCLYPIIVSTPLVIIDVVLVLRSTRN